MNFTYFTLINAIVSVWCIIAIGLLWGSWSNADTTSKTAVAFATPVVVYSLVMALFYFGKDMLADKTTDFMGKSTFMSKLKGE